MNEDYYKFLIDNQKDIFVCISGSYDKYVYTIFNHEYIRKREWENFGVTECSIITFNNFKELYQDLVKQCEYYRNINV